jgi:hypothetical protein
MKPLLLLSLALFVSGCESTRIATDGAAAKPATAQTSRVVLASEVKWVALNPARGDLSPKAGTLWGDQTGKGASGFLVKFVDGFKSPPHIHNITYRGVAIAGLIHNADPNAETMWMSAGSYWTQPKGAVHITAAKGSTSMAYIEIGDGPYLVRPVDMAFAGTEKPINMDASNIVWVDLPGMRPAADGPKLAYLWGQPRDGELNGTLVKLPAGFVGTLRGNGSTLRAVVIQGLTQYQAPGQTGTQALAPGSHFSSEGKSMHRLRCDMGGECIVYLRTEGRVDIGPT